jgi:hypothetical protein
MTHSEFTATWNGRFNNFDGAYGPQCVDIVQQYSTDVLGVGPFGYGNAIGRWTHYPQDKFIRIPNTITAVPQKGDIIIWGTKVGPNGHIAIFESGNVWSFTSFDQNWPLHTVCHFQKHSYSGVLGWLRKR